MIIRIEAVAIMIIAILTGFIIWHLWVKLVLKADAVIECEKLYNRIIAPAKFGNAFGVKDFRRLVLVSDKYSIQLTKFGEKSHKELACIAASGLEKHLEFVAQNHSDLYSEDQLKELKCDLLEFKKAWGLD